MTQLARQEYAAALRGRYGIASKRQKGEIQDEFCRITGCHRKAAIRILHPYQLAAHKRPRGRPPRYGRKVLPVLERLWQLGDRSWQRGQLDPFCPFVGQGFPILHTL